jgi:sugar fermentation stimulation protein A
MIFSQPLLEGRFLRRYKRFFADVELGGKTVVAHVANTGSMLGAIREGCACRLSRSDNPKRKLLYTLEMLRPGRVWIGVNTGLSNRLIGEAWQRRRVAHWLDFDHAAAEITVSSSSRLDWVMWTSRPGLSSRAQLRAADLRSCGPLHFIEVKNVSLAENGVALFPESVSVRAARHMAELVELVGMGHSAEIVFTVQRSDASRLSPAELIDPEYATALRHAAAAGVRISPFQCQLRRDGITLKTSNPLAVDL